MDPVITRRPLAFEDLVEIWAFIAEDSERQADRFLATIDSKLRLLAHEPLIGRAREELLPGLRSFPVGRYVLFYVPAEDGIEVVRVLHSARDIDLDDFQPEGGS